MLKVLDEFKAGGTKMSCSFVGFDSTPVLLKGVRDGKIAALIVQDPKHMGYLGVQTMVAHLKGETVPGNVPTATAVVTKDNVDSPEIKAVTLEK